MKVHDRVQCSLPCQPFFLSVQKQSNGTNRNTGVVEEERQGSRRPGRQHQSKGSTPTSSKLWRPSKCLRTQARPLHCQQSFSGLEDTNRSTLPRACPHGRHPGQGTPVLTRWPSPIGSEDSGQGPTSTSQSGNGVLLHVAVTNM